MPAKIYSLGYASFSFSYILLITANNVSCRFKSCATIYIGILGKLLGGLLIYLGQAFVRRTRALGPELLSTRTTLCSKKVTPKFKSL